MTNYNQNFNIKLFLIFKNQECDHFKCAACNTLKV